MPGAYWRYPGRRPWAWLGWCWHYQALGSGRSSAGVSPGAGPGPGGAVLALPGPRVWPERCWRYPGIPRAPALRYGWRGVGITRPWVWPGRWWQAPSGWGGPRWWHRGPVSLPCPWLPWGGRWARVCSLGRLLPAAVLPPLEAPRVWAPRSAARRVHPVRALMSARCEVEPFP